MIFDWQMDVSEKQCNILRRKKFLPNAVWFEVDSGLHLCQPEQSMDPLPDT